MKDSNNFQEKKKKNTTAHFQIFFKMKGLPEKQNIQSFFICPYCILLSEKYYVVL
jgi:hypothetical protein